MRFDRMPVRCLHSSFACFVFIYKHLRYGFSNNRIKTGTTRETRCMSVEMKHADCKESVLVASYLFSSAERLASSSRLRGSSSFSVLTTAGPGLPPPKTPSLRPELRAGSVLGSFAAVPERTKAKSRTKGVSACVQWKSWHVAPWQGFTRRLLTGSRMRPVHERAW